MSYPLRCVPCNVWWEVDSCPPTERLMVCPIYLGEPPLAMASDLCRTARGRLVKDYYAP